jgi:flagellar hook-length control protein FliK
MHLAMNTELLGSVDVHAVVRQSTVSATIGVQRPDVQTLLASDLPALQHALSERSLHVEQISVLGGSTGGQTDSSRHAPQNPQDWRMLSGGFAGGGSRGESRGTSVTEIAAATSRSAVAGRLSVHV